jgi:hypothetical protein
MQIYSLRAYDTQAHRHVYWQSNNPAMAPEATQPPSAKDANLVNTCVLCKSTQHTEVFELTDDTLTHVLTHGLNGYPQVLILMTLNSGDKEPIIGDVLYKSKSELSITFTQAINCEVHLS